jgi:hypothetical protein
MTNFSCDFSDEPCPGMRRRPDLLKILSGNRGRGLRETPAAGWRSAGTKPTLDRF